MNDQNECRDVHMTPNLENAAQTPPEIAGNDITTLLIVRYLCSYLLYDANLSHAYNSFHNTDHERCVRAVERANSTSPNGRSQSEHLNRIYNLVLAEETEELIAHICGEHISRAEYELFLAETAAEYFNLPLHGQKEDT